ncbi:MAG TPA: hypothetical protein VJI13_04065, partial [Candidatus Norongarragalinales archaeon]|nr:hypothetical protein [Candidatus Norongarragalinales archaeon]
DALESFHKDISAMVELMDVPVNADGYVSGPMDVQSSITGQDFANYVLEYMQSSQYPTGSWAFLSSSNSIPGDGIVLNDYDTRLLPDGKLILKLTVTDADGQQGNDMVIITVRNAPNIGLLSGLASPPSKEQNVLEATGGVIGYFGAVATALGQSQGSCPGCTYAWYKDNALQAASGPDYSATFAQYPYVHEVKVGVTDPSNGKSSEAKMKVISGAVTRVTTHTAAQQNPSVSGSKMVWEDNRNGYDIYAYDIATGVQLQITNLSSKQANPDIYGNRIVYEDNRNGNYEIYMYDLSTGLETRITNNPSSQYSPAIYGNRIVWEDNRNGITNYDLYMYDILTGTETQLTTDPKSQWGASIYGDKIAYTDEREGNWDIYIYDITSGTETRITQASEYPMNVDIYGTRLVWEDFRDNANFGRIYMYDLATGTESRLTSSESYDPEIYGNRVVWEDYRNGNADIYSMDVATMQEIPVTGNSSSQDHPAIYGEVIVWEDSRNSGNDIYYIPNISQPSRPRCYYDKKTQQWLPRGCNRQA